MGRCPILLSQNRDSFCGVISLGASGDYDYPQAPLQAVKQPTEDSTDAEVKAWDLWNQLKRTVKHVNYQKIVEKEDKTSPIQEVSCQYGLCEII